MDGIWQLQEAKNKLSEVIARARRKGPQVITKHGEKVVAVVAYEEYEKLRRSRGKLSEFFQASPLAGLDLGRDKSLPRPGIDL